VCAARTVDGHILGRQRELSGAGLRGKVCDGDLLGTHGNISVLQHVESQEEEVEPVRSRSTRVERVSPSASDHINPPCTARHERDVDECGEGRDEGGQRGHFLQQQSHGRCSRLART
jgi:hypothetical protein